MATLTLTRIERIRSHAGKARYSATLDYDTPLGYIPRQADIPSPYMFSATWTVWRHVPSGTPVVIIETSHRCYDVFRVDGPLYMTETAATNASLADARRRNAAGQRVTRPCRACAAFNPLAAERCVGCSLPMPTMGAN